MYERLRRRCPHSNLAEYSAVWVVWTLLLGSPGEQRLLQRRAEVAADLVEAQPDVQAPVIPSQVSWGLQGSPFPATGSRLVLASLLLGLLAVTQLRNQHLVRQHVCNLHSTCSLRLSVVLMVRRAQVSGISRCMVQQARHTQDARARAASSAMTGVPRLV